MHGTRLDANGHLAFSNSLRTAVALHAMTLLAINARGIVRTRHVAIAAADAFVDVNRHQTGLGIFVHRSGRAHLGARRVIAVAAGNRGVVCERVCSPAAIRILFPSAIADLVYAAIPKLFAQIMIVSASKLTGFASRAALTVKKERLLSHSLFLPYAFSTWPILLCCGLHLPSGVGFAMVNVLMHPP